MQVQYRTYTTVSCSSCKKEWEKRTDSLKYWLGNCPNCAQRIAKNKPEVIEKASRFARAQVIKQGGIPNANHFTSERVRGPANCNWRGGITPINQKIRHSQEYKEWRSAVFARDDYTCQHCGQRGGKLNADHIKRFSEFHELRLDINNGRTLCEPCHKKTDTYSRRGMRGNNH